MKILIASDHAGFSLKQQIVNSLIQDITFTDLGPFDVSSVDYPDYAKRLCEMIQKEEGAMGILICYTGIGMSIVANKYDGIRAALVDDESEASLTRSHNNANVLCLSARRLTCEKAIAIIKIFTSTSFAGERHQRRLDKIKEIEKNR